MRNRTTLGENSRRKGHTVKLIQPTRVKAFLSQRNKTDAADGKNLCEALMHPCSVFVRVKTLEQQEMDHLLDRRQRPDKERTHIVNQTRDFLAERGITIQQWFYPLPELPRLLCP